ncbi:hypothetical protein [Kordiimonas sp.]|uniref:hypothetical protein n=1 Tax=Kordiimonas sp. TaxID=1970157 RepID=UPI003A923AD5
MTQTKQPLRPTRRTFLGTMLAVVSAPSLPEIAVPEMRFHSVGVGGELAELFYTGYDDDRSWLIVPAYDADQAIQQVRKMVIECTRNSTREWPEEDGDIGVHSFVAESDVIESAKEWGINFDMAASRLMYWRCESDTCCEHCGMYGLDGMVPTCDECWRCKFCVEDGVKHTESGLIERSGPCPHCHWT